MLKMPRAVDRKARDVGMQEWKAEEKLMRYWLVGVQCSGRLAQVPRRLDRNIVAVVVSGREQSMHVVHVSAIRSERMILSKDVCWNW